MSQSVVVVDDNALTRALLSDALRSSGYQPIAYASARDALQAITAEVPAACVVDHTMPGMNGAELVRALRTSDDGRLRELPVIGVTARFGEELLAAGADLCIAKPFTEASVAEAVRAALSRRSAAPAGPSRGTSLAEFRRMHERARAGALTAVDAAAYRAMRSELARTFLAMQHATLPPRSRARKGLRVAASLRVDLQLGGQPLYARCVDLGQGGFSVLLGRAPPLGTRVRFRLQLAETDWVDGFARVANALPADDRSERVGFAFVGLDPNQLDRVEMRVFDEVVDQLDAARTG